MKTLKELEAIRQKTLNELNLRKNREAYQRHGFPNWLHRTLPLGTHRGSLSPRPGEGNLLQGNPGSSGAHRIGAYRQREPRYGIHHRQF